MRKKEEIQNGRKPWWLPPDDCRYLYSLNLSGWREEDDLFGDNLRLLSLLAIPTVGLEVALDVERLSLLHVRCAGVGEGAPYDDVVELGKLLLCSCTVLPPAVGGEIEGADVLAGRGGLELGSAGDVAEEDD